MIDREKIWSVGGFLDHLNDVLGGEEVSIQGEVDDLKKHPTGFYFVLKDKEGGGVLPCYFSPWKARASGLDFEDGFLVKVSGVPSIYKPRGNFSFVVNEMELVGEGSLKKAYELLKAKLEKEGLFERKRPLPDFISSVGVITSKTGAVIDDFRKNLKKLGLKVYLYDSRVEGAKAVPNIMAGIDYFNDEMSDKLNLLVLIRGGGSLEDLQAFNNEVVARKIFSSRIPVLCGIGHDRDVPIVSLVCDRSVSTPSMAAQTVNSSWDGLFSGLPMLEEKLMSAFERDLSRIRNEFSSASEPLSGLFSSEIERLKDKIGHLSKYLSAADPINNLKLGYSVVFGEDDHVVKDVKFLKKGDKIKTKLYKGSLESEISKIIN